MIENLNLQVGNKTFHSTVYLSSRGEGTTVQRKSLIKSPILYARSRHDPDMRSTSGAISTPAPPPGPVVQVHTVQVHIHLAALIS